MAYRTGTIYLEWSYRRFARGVGMYRRTRWCAEICVCGKRYRCRSSSEACARAWLTDMLERFPEYTTGGDRHGKPAKGSTKPRRAGKNP